MDAYTLKIIGLLVTSVVFLFACAFLVIPIVKLKAKRIIADAKEEAKAEAERIIAYSATLINPDSGAAFVWLVDDIVASGYTFPEPELGKNKSGYFDDLDTLFRKRNEWDRQLAEHKERVDSVAEAEARVEQKLTIVAELHAWARQKRQWLNERHSALKEMNRELKEERRLLDLRDIDVPRLETLANEIRSIAHGRHCTDWHLGQAIYEPDGDEWVVTKKKAILSIIHNQLEGKASLRKIYPLLESVSDAAEDAHHQRITHHFVRDFLNEITFGEDNPKILFFDNMPYVLIPVAQTGARQLVPITDLVFSWEFKKNKSNGHVLEVQTADL